MSNPTAATFTIPVADGTTITETNGVLSAVPQTAPAGSTVSYVNGVLTVNGVAVTNITLGVITADELALINGTTYPAGNYIVTFDTSGNLTYTPYVPVTSGSGTAAAAAKYTVTVPAIALYGSGFYPVMNGTTQLTLAAGQAIQGNPIPVFSATSASPLAVTNNAVNEYLQCGTQVWVDATTSAVWLYVANKDSKAQTGPTTWLVVVR